MPSLHLPVADVGHRWVHRSALHPCTTAILNLGDRLPDRFDELADLDDREHHRNDARPGEVEEEDGQGIARQDLVKQSHGDEDHG